MLISLLKDGPFVILVLCVSLSSKLIITTSGFVLIPF